MPPGLGWLPESFSSATSLSEVGERVSFGRGVCPVKFLWIVRYYLAYIDCLECQKERKKHDLFAVLLEKVSSTVDFKWNMALIQPGVARNMLIGKFEFDLHWLLQGDIFGLKQLASGILGQCPTSWCLSILMDHAAQITTAGRDSKV